MIIPPRPTTHFFSTFIHTSSHYDYTTRLGFWTNWTKIARPWCGFASVVVPCHWYINAEHHLLQRASFYLDLCGMRATRTWRKQKSWKSEFVASNPTSKVRKNNGCFLSFFLSMRKLQASHWAMTIRRSVVLLLFSIPFVHRFVFDFRSLGPLKTVHFAWEG